MPEALALDIQDLDPDPLVQFARWFEAAQTCGNPEPTAMTLATATAGGIPSARMVLLKGADAQGLVFFTNYQSAKARELTENSSAALVFFWPELHRQIRVTGKAVRVSRDESAGYFATRPLGSRIGAWASKQSEPLIDRAELERRYQEVARRYPDGAVPLPEHWGGFRVVPDSLEFWQGRESRLHDRFLYRRAPGGGWTLQRLYP